eukprot:TRINITY_DN2978_c0_g1_i1.p1 TRINITY_DN2978_c0_g1~~TRINITY_DN2978_c0_g1_i1.p1  ORF type:complete len:549 (-),score=211.39 TRINITY_DN2978_c0_g1_i1:42-1529(-)
MDQSSKEIAYNAKYDTMWKPIAGPINPTGNDALVREKKNHLSGNVEDYSVDDFAFNDQYLAFQKTGVAEDPSGRGTLVYQNKTEKNSMKQYDDRKRKERNWDSGDMDSYTGPWSGFKDQEQAELTDEQKELLEARKQKKAKLNNKTSSNEFVESVKYHGKWAKANKTDYQGRSIFTPPSELHTVENWEDHQTYLPKREEHIWTGHTKGVSRIRWFPKYGHILMSGGLDGDIKLWDLYNTRGCMATINGHSKGIRDVVWNDSGENILSCSYDTSVKLWDTETCKVVQKMTNGKVPICCVFHPELSHVVLAGTQDHRIMQYDTRSGKVINDYDRHLKAVNSVTFVNHNQQFMTTSDDQTIRVFEYDINVEVKYISEPYMQSMPAVTKHPSEKWVACQSMDNQILVYEAQGRFKLNKKKRFTGHLVSGYACQLDFSPDGRFLISGDADGRAMVWDWKTGRLCKKLKAHKGVCLQAVWHPTEVSTVATCGWDGQVKLFT